jgi:organic hydroperoxide reductase OsmC/OhrA
VGTASYRSYDRANEVRAEGAPTILGSSDPAFRGDPRRWNPEQLLLASLSQCHLLWYLHLAAEAGVVVMAYQDDATATMVTEPTGGGRFTEAVLRPRVQVADAGMVQRATELHQRANELCFIANSVTFPVRHEPATSVHA